MTTTQIKMKEPGRKKRKKKGQKDPQGSKGKEKKGRCLTLQISCVPLLMTSTTSKLHNTKTNNIHEKLLSSDWLR